MFAYTPEIINDLELSISRDRLSTYLNATDGNREKALKLYLWNSEISSAFYIPLQGLEITLRNALHIVLSEKFRNDRWYDLPVLDQRGAGIVETAKDTVRRNHQMVNSPHVVAELSFGFWVSLLNRKYHQNLWIPALGKAFPHAHLPRSDVHLALDHIRILRNRIAHHEPVFRRHLAEDYKSIIRIIGWMNAGKALWIDRHNHVARVLQQRP